MQIIRDVDQGTDQWLQMRLGVITASKYKDVMAKGQGKTRATYMRQLAAESLTGAPLDVFKNTAMEWGNETEPQAKAMYMLMEGCEVDEIAFCKHDSINTGVSPDGLVGDAGLIEIKSPNSTTQIETFLSGKMPTCHKAQVQGQLWVMERDWCDFVSFDPRIDGKASYFKRRITRDENYISELEQAVIAFDSELKEMIDKLK
jgi:putative phage-type endonuclease